jgi:uncharacterized membrane protein
MDPWGKRDQLFESFFLEKPGDFLKEVFLPIVVAFLLLSIGLIILFLLSFWRQHYSLWHIGKAEDCSGRRVTRLKTVFAVAFGQDRIWKELYPGTMHFLIFWGVLLIFLGKIIRLFSYPMGLTTPPSSSFSMPPFFPKSVGRWRLWVDF